SLAQQQLFVLVWNYHDDDMPAPASPVELSVSGLPWSNGIAHAKQFRIDASHSNAFEFWKRLGSPQNPTAEQYRKLEKAGQLDLLETKDTPVQGGQANWHFTLPRQGVSLFVVEK